LKIKKEWTRTDMARKVWEELAKKANELKIKEIVFDRNWFDYHWRIKSLAETLREAWLKF
jgi:large subunit ribosomal protein L18